jgi:hypothetical protein
MPPLDEGPEVPAFSRCSVGIGRWFWVAWDTWGDARAGGAAAACGYEKSAQAAEAKAIGSVGPRARSLPAKWASGYRRRGTGGPRTGRPEEGGRDAPGRARLGRGAKDRVGTAGLELLYRAYEGDRRDSPGSVVVVKHRIVKKTARKIYVDRAPFREDQWERRGEEGGSEPSGHDPAARMMIIDRAGLSRSTLPPDTREAPRPVQYTTRAVNLPALDW